MWVALPLLASSTNGPLCNWQFLLPASVTILGADLTGATSVTFNGSPATLTVLAPSAIAPTIPSGAATGRVQVTTPNGTLSSKVPFQVLP